MSRQPSSFLFRITYQDGAERHQYLDAAATQLLFSVTCWAKIYYTNEDLHDKVVDAPNEASNPNSDDPKVTNKLDTTYIKKDDIVQFDTDHNAELSTLSLGTPSYSSLITPMKGDIDHSIKSFLARPYKYSSFKFASSNLRNQEIASFYMFSDMVNLPYYKQKLAGFYGFRATTHVRLQVNGNRFQQGRLFLTYNPSAFTSSAHTACNLSLVRSTQLIRANLDVNLDTEATIVVPYISDTPFYQFNGTQFDFFGGHVAVRVYAPLLVGSSSELEIDCSLWIHFTDVELFWPSSYLSPQSGVAGTKFKKPTNEITGPHKPVASFLGRVADASQVLTAIPILSSYAAPLSWSSRILSKAAAAMGWCKPHSCEKKVFSIQQSAGWTNGTGYDYSENMGVFEDASVKVIDDLAGSSVDQMSLSYVLSVPTWWTSFPLYANNPAGYLLSSLSMNPSDFYNPIGDFANPAIIAPTPLKYFSTMFSYWRGTIKVRIVCVKTEFHTGRIRVAYEPSGANLNEANSIYNFSEILDLKQASEWVIDVPYTSALPYLTTRNDIGEVNGKLFFTLLNELRAPDNVAQSVDFNIEVCGGSNFEFAVPTQSVTNYPVIRSHSGTAPITSTQTNVGASLVVIHSQGAFDENDSHLLTGNHPIANCPVQEPTLEPSEFCIGERITSLKQLALRPCYIFTTCLGQRCINLDAPRQFWKAGGVNNPSWGPSETPSYMDRILPCYAFYRGGVTCKIAPSFSTTSSGLSASYQSADVSYQRRDQLNTVSVFPWNSGQSRPAYSGLWCPSQAQYTTTTSLSLDVTVPHYCPLPVRRTPLTYDGFIDGQGSWLKQRYARVLSIYTPRDFTHLNDNKTPNFTANVYISAADDFQCGFFIGCPFLTNSGILAGLKLNDAENYSGVQRFPQVP